MNGTFGGNFPALSGLFAPQIKLVSEILAIDMVNKARKILAIDMVNKARIRDSCNRYGK